MKKIIKCEDIEFQIYIEDTDFQGVVYHSNYLKYFERSRSEFLSYANISQNKLREKDLAFIVKSIKINYLKAAELGNQIVIDKISREEFVNGEVEICFINLSSKKPKKFPDDLLLIFD